MRSSKGINLAILSFVLVLLLLSQQKLDVQAASFNITQQNSDILTDEQPDPSFVVTAKYGDTLYFPKNSYVIFYGSKDGEHSLYSLKGWTDIFNLWSSPNVDFTDMPDPSADYLINTDSLTLSCGIIEKDFTENGFGPYYRAYIYPHKFSSGKAYWFLYVSPTGSAEDYHPETAITASAAQTPQAAPAGEYKQNGSDFFYFENNTPVTNSWRNVTINGAIYQRYFDAQGKMATGWVQMDDGSYKYFNESELLDGAKSGQGTDSYLGVYIPNSSIAAKLKTYSPKAQLAGYTDVTSFINDPALNWAALGYSFTEAKETIDAMIKGIHNHDLSNESLVNSIMNDPDTCRETLRDLVDENSEYGYTSISENEQTYAKAGTDVVLALYKKRIGYSDLSKELQEQIDNSLEQSGNMLMMITAACNLSAAVSNATKDYSRNIEYLQSLAQNVPESSQFHQIIANTINDYRNSFAAYLLDNGFSDTITLFLRNSSIPLPNVSVRSAINGGELIKGADAISFMQVIVSGGGLSGIDISTADKLLDATIGQVQPVNSVSEVVNINGILTTSLSALKKAEEKVVASSGNPDKLNSAIADYIHVFAITKSAKTKEYKAMRDFYPEGSDKYNYYNSKLLAISNISPYSTDVNFKNSYDNALGEGNGGGGFR
jgi:hypothetical protein